MAAVIRTRQTPFEFTRLFGISYLTSLFGGHLAQQQVTVLLCPLVVRVGVQRRIQPTICLNQIAWHAASDSVQRCQSIPCPNISLCRCFVQQEHGLCATAWHTFEPEIFICHVDGRVRIPVCCVLRDRTIGGTVWPGRLVLVRRTGPGLRCMICGVHCLTLITRRFALRRHCTFHRRAARRKDQR